MGTRFSQYRNCKVRPIALLLCLIAAAAVAPAIHAADEPLTLGVFPRNKASETTTMYTPLATYLSEQLGRKVVLMTSKDFETFWKGVTERQFDVVHYNQYHFIRSAQSYRVIARTQEFEERGRGCALRAQG